MPSSGNKGKACYSTQLQPSLQQHKHGDVVLFSCNIATFCFSFQLFFGLGIKIMAFCPSLFTKLKGCKIYKVLVQMYNYPRPLYILIYCTELRTLLDFASALAVLASEQNITTLLLINKNFALLVLFRLG